MADTTISASDDVIAWIHDNGGSDAGHNFRVVHLTSTAELFRVKESGEVVLTGRVLRDDVHRIENTTIGSGTIASFLRNGTTRLELYYDASEGQVGLGTPSAQGENLTFQAAGNACVVVDHDDDQSGNRVTIRDASGLDGFVFQDDGQFEMAHEGTTYIRLSYGSDDALFEVGLGSDTRGTVEIHARQTTSAERAGLLKLQDKDGVWWFLWTDASNVLRIADTDPGEDDTAGTVVGTQT